MITRIFFFLIGFFLIVMGIMYMIIYLNLLSFGYNFLEYLTYILTHYECLVIIPGIIIVLLCIFKKGKSDVKRI